MTFGQRFARAVTVVVVRVPPLWRLLRGPLTRNFDRLAPEWDVLRVDPARLVAIGAALEAVDPPPSRVLDLGTGSGAVARLAAARWPEAAVTGADVSSGMIAEAKRLADSPNQVYEVADASALPYADGSFDLVTMNNAIPFFDELARVTAPGGLVAIAYARGARTPIYVPPARIRAALEQRGFTHAADFEVDGGGQSMLARKRS